MYFSMMTLSTTVLSKEFMISTFSCFVVVAAEKPRMLSRRVKLLLLDSTENNFSTLVQQRHLTYWESSWRLKSLHKYINIQDK